MKSLDYLKLVEQRGYMTQPNCSTVLWAHKVSQENPEEFIRLLRDNSNFTTTEMIFLVNKLHDVIPADIIENWIRRVCADPDAAGILAVFALRWKTGDSRKKIFFEEFVKTFADNPHYHLSQMMFSNAGGSDE